MPKSCIMFVWKIKFYSCVVRLLSYWVHCWNLIFQHKAHYVFRNPSWCHTFHFDVNFSLLSFVSRLHFAINVLTVNPFVMCGCVYQRFVRLDSQHPLNESLSHTCPWVWALISWNQLECKSIGVYIINNETVKWWGSHEVNVFWVFFLSPKRDRKT